MTPLFAEPPLAVARVNDPIGLRRGRALLLEHAFELRAALGVDPCTADIALRDALADPVAAFVHGSSSLLVATDSGRDIGVAVVEPHSNGTAQLRHLYVRPSARRVGVGRALMSAAVVHCRIAGHRTLWVDPIADITAPVHALGASFGFTKNSDGAQLALTHCQS
jgi:GNAT superfamily N-acetyltransferase